MEPTYEGIVVSPAIGGGTNWFSPAYNPQTGLFYVNAFDSEQEFFKRDEDYEEGERYTGGGGQYIQPMDTYNSAIRAIDPATADIVWEFPVQPRTTAGVMSTAGGLIFSGSVDGYFYALDSSNGNELWHMSLGARVHSAPMTYAVDGRQYVSIAAGNVVFTFALED
jgi:alcohol dehydrogenase (cytochrome c)